MKNVFEYMGWCKHELKINGDCKFCGINRPETHPLDGNLMVSAIQKMRENGDWVGFIISTYHDKSCNDVSVIPLIAWLTNPANFFRLMKEALEKNIIGNDKGLLHPDIENMEEAKDENGKWK